MYGEVCHIIFDLNLSQIVNVVVKNGLLIFRSFCLCLDSQNSSCFVRSPILCISMAIQSAPSLEFKILSEFTRFATS